MKDTINRVVVSILEFGRRYSDWFGTSLQMEDREVIPIEILEKACFICISDEKLNQHKERNKNVLEAIREILWNYVVVSENKEAGLVKFEGFQENVDPSEYEKSIALCFIQYNFTIAEELWQERNEFLWISVLFPYIYKLEKFRVVKGTKKDKQSELQSLLDKYPVDDSGKKAKEIFEEFMEKIGEDAYFEEVLKREPGLEHNIIEADFNNMVSECRQGISAALQIFNKR